VAGLGKLWGIPSIRPIRWTAFLRSCITTREPRAMILIRPSDPHAGAARGGVPESIPITLAFGNPNPYSQEPMSHLSNGYSLSSYRLRRR